MYVPAVVLKRYFDEYMKMFDKQELILASCGLDGIELEFFNHLVEKFKDVDFYTDAKNTTDIYRIWDRVDTDER